MRTLRSGLSARVVLPTAEDLDTDDEGAAEDGDEEPVDNADFLEDFADDTEVRICDISESSRSSAYKTLGTGANAPANWISRESAPGEVQGPPEEAMSAPELHIPPRPSDVPETD